MISYDLKHNPQIKIIEGIMTYNIRNPKINTLPENHEFWGQLFQEDTNFLINWIENLNKIDIKDSKLNEYKGKWNIKLLETMDPKTVYNIITSAHENEAISTQGILKEITPIDFE